MDAGQEVLRARDTWSTAKVQDWTTERVEAGMEHHGNEGTRWCQEKTAPQAPATSRAAHGSLQCGVKTWDQHPLWSPSAVTPNTQMNLVGGRVSQIDFNSVHFIFERGHKEQNFSDPGKPLQGVSW